MSKKEEHIINSSLYECEVFHSRMEKVHRSFRYKTFLFCIDLDELPVLSKTLWFVSHNRFNYFNFRDKDHLQLTKSGEARSVRFEVEQFLQKQGIHQHPSKIILLTNLCTLGYQFNPVSFYYCFDEENNTLGSIAEVNNTYGEMKLFYLGKENYSDGKFTDRKKKHFYVSPFIQHDVDFDFELSIPEKVFFNKIDDYKDGNRIFTASLRGKQLALNNRNVIRFMLRFPIITLQVIFLIHYQALKLYLKGVPYLRKNEHLDLQRDRLKKYEEKNKLTDKNLSSWKTQ